MAIRHELVRAMLSATQVGVGSCVSAVHRRTTRSGYRSELAVPAAARRPIAVRYSIEGAADRPDEQRPQHSLSRRQAATALLLSATLLASPQANAASADVTSKVFFDIEVDGEPLGRIIIGVFGDASPLAASRFVALAKGVENIGYRRTAIDQIRPGQFIRAAGVRSFSYTEDAAPTEVPGGETAERLLPELEASTLKHDAAGLVSLVVLSDVELEPAKERLVARGGQLLSIQNGPPPGPNGTGFAITLGSCAELNGVSLVVGKVIEGQEVVRAISELQFAKPNANSPYFQVAKSIGDARAKLAEKGFGRPLVPVRVAKSGAL